MLNRHTKLSMKSLMALQMLRHVTRLALFAAPFALLCFKLHAEMREGTLPLDGSAVLMRFIVVGLFALLLSRWCMHWMTGGR